MADDLSESVDSLKYLAARPGTFEVFYPETTNDMLVTVLRDGMAECHLEGLLTKYESDEDGIVTPALSSGQVAMVVLFATVRFMRAELFNRNTSVTYKAGSADYETTQATNILRDILKALEAQKGRVIAASAGGSGSDAGNVAFFMADQYLARAWDSGRTEAVAAYYGGPYAVGW